jgi:hypothetical protein
VRTERGIRVGYERDPLPADRLAELLGQILAAADATAATVAAVEM